MISVRPIRCAFLGIRYRAHCLRCHIDLPGRHPERTQALAAGNAHIQLRHGGAA